MPLCLCGLPPSVVTTAPPAASAAHPSASSPLLLAAEALRGQLQRRRPSAELLYDSPDAVGDLCTAVELVLERFAVRLAC